MCTKLGPLLKQTKEELSVEEQTLVDKHEHFVEEVEEWASNRAQHVYRTVDGAVHVLKAVKLLRMKVQPKALDAEGRQVPAKGEHQERKLHHPY